MVALLFDVGGQRYALDVVQVLRVVPYVRLRRLPAAPEYIAGVFQYRGVMVPVIDLSLLMTGRPVAALLSTRILLAQYPMPDGPPRVLGLLVERATDSIEDDAEQLKSPGIALPETPYLGGISSTGGGLIQYVKVEEMLPAELRQRLFADADEAGELPQMESLQAPETLVKQLPAGLPDSMPDSTPDRREDRT